MKVKFYDKRDFDFYNPKPYITHLLSFIDNKPGNADVRDLRWKLDADKYSYLFEKIDTEFVSGWVIKSDFINLIKQEHMSAIICGLEMFLTSKASHMDAKVEELKMEVKRREDNIKDEQNKIEELKKELQDTLNVIEKYKVDESN